MVQQHPHSALDSARPSPCSTPAILPALELLDRHLAHALVLAQALFGSQAAVDPYRGLYISQEEAEQILGRHPGQPLYFPQAPAPEELLALVSAAPPLQWLQAAYDLEVFDLQVLVLAAAPEIDRRYERLYAYLQDDVTCKRPTVDLALNLFCQTREDKLAARQRFLSEAPLRLHNLVQVWPDANQKLPSLLGHFLSVDDQILRLLLGQDYLDPRLCPLCQVLAPEGPLGELFLAPEVTEPLRVLVQRAWQAEQPFSLYLHGPAGLGKTDLAEALAKEVGAGLLVMHAAALEHGQAELGNFFRLLFREARWRRALVCLQGLDIFWAAEKPGWRYQEFLQALAQEPPPGIIMTGRQGGGLKAELPPGCLAVRLPLPDFPRRLACWQATLEKTGLPLPAAQVKELAGRFRLTPRQILAAATVGARLLPLPQKPLPGGTRTPQPQGEIFHHLCETIRSQTEHVLGPLAQKIVPRASWPDIILPVETQRQLQEICQRLRYGQRVMEEWGFGAKLSRGRGVNALFTGPPGVGKTMATEILAHDLGLDLFRIDLAGIVSKYIGETEKNLETIFTRAQDANIILFFDEADALFGKRSEVRDSHDRYANLEISYLLQKMEEYEGVSILATNMRHNLDEAFARRLQFSIHFPFPDEDSRREIWRKIWPPQTPLAKNLDIHWLAHKFKLSGGNIKNIALAAAFLAAANGRQIGMEHILQAIQREYQKLGKPVADADLIYPDPG